MGLSLHWDAVGSGCPARVSRHVQRLALRTATYHCTKIPLASLPTLSYFRPHFLLPCVSVHWLPRSCSWFTERKQKWNGNVCIERKFWKAVRIYNFAQRFKSFVSVVCSPGSCLTERFSECSLSQLLVWPELFPELCDWGWMHAKLMYLMFLLFLPLSSLLQRGTTE